MTITIDLAPEAEARLQQEAIRNGQDTQEFVKGLLEQQVSFLLSRPAEPPAWLAELKPRDPAYADRNGFADIVGKWPGDESDAVVQAALEKMS
ncbi:MAG: hypothetical protein JO250_08860 [Armatimonadetes bacterium]|nr:hypothetical protein [Armatimonadota bacterium]